MKEFIKQIESEDNEKVQKNEKDRQTAEDLQQQRPRKENKTMETVMMIHHQKGKKLEIQDQTQLCTCVKKQEKNLS